MTLLSRIFTSKETMKYEEDLKKYESKMTEWKGKLEKRMEKDQDWFFPIMLAVASGGIGFIDSFFKDKATIIGSSNIRYLGILGIALFILSILSNLFHFYLSIRWSSKLLEGKTDSTCGLNNLRHLIDLGFWLLVIAVFISIFFYSYVQFK